MIKMIITVTNIIIIISLLLLLLIFPHAWRMAVAVWHSGNVLTLIKIVALHRARLVLGWVTIHGYTILVFNQATQA